MKDSEMLSRYGSIGEAISAACARNPQREATVFIGEDGVREHITAAQLHHEADACAAVLGSLGVAPHELVILALRHSRSLFVATLGIVYRGAVLSVFPYPTERQDQATYLQALQSLVRESGARAVICLADFVAPLTELLDGTDCQVIASDVLSTGSAAAAPLAPRQNDHDSVAFVQYTSGTTGPKKGILLTHRAVLDYLSAWASEGVPRADDVFVNWVPLYHDMGLMTGFIMPLVGGVGMVLMSPFCWVRNPVTLLHAVQEFRGTLTAMPNFAFNLCTRTIRERDLAGLDLSSWRMLFNGAEPVRPESIEAFYARFSPYGLRQSALLTAYGMAETVLTITYTKGSGPPRVDRVRGLALQEEHRAIPADPEESGVRSIVSNGRPLPGIELAIVDPNGVHLPERHLGEITLRSSFMLSGYHMRPELTAQVIRDGWFHTGDIGYLADGELYICGRNKDVIIVGGSNIHPEDVEAIASRIPELQPGRSVAFGIADERSGTERVVVVCELRDGLPADAARGVEEQLRHRVAHEMRVALTVRIVEKGWVVKTSSGKLARSANREKYLGAFEANRDVRNTRPL